MVHLLIGQFHVLEFQGAFDTGQATGQFLDTGEDHVPILNVLDIEEFPLPVAIRLEGVELLWVGAGVGWFWLAAEIVGIPHINPLATQDPQLTRMVLLSTSSELMRQWQQSSHFRWRPPPIALPNIPLRFIGPSRSVA